MRKLMFVDDEPNLLAGLRRMLRSQRNEWEMDFLDGGEAALQRLKKGPVDIVVSDMRMPAMDGAQLLTQIRKQAPQTVRLCLSGFSDTGLVLRGLGSIHQYLNKPCESNRLIEILRGILEAGSELPDELSTRLSGLAALPVAQASLDSLRGALQSVAPTVEELGRIVTQDLGLTARLVQLVHSGFFGLPRHLEGIEDACRLLGVGNIRKLAESSECFASDPSQDQAWLVGLGQRAQSVSQRAADLAAAAGLSQLSCGHARVGGALVGLAELACASCGWATLEPAAATFLMTLWGLPAPIIESARYLAPPTQMVPSPLAMVWQATQEIPGAMVAGREAKG